MQPREGGDLAIGTPPPVGRRGPSEGGRWLVANALAERERWPLWVPVLVGAGSGLISG